MEYGDKNNVLINIEGKKWYYYLKEDGNKKTLLNVYPLSTLNNKLIVSYTFKGNDKREKRVFGYFESYVEFGIYQMRFKEEKRCFYEEIFGEYPQKPRFDIDIKIDEERESEIDNEDIKDKVIEKIIEIFNENGIKIELKKDILICTSHGKNKKSYHIIIDNYCHLNNKEAKSFYNLVINRLPENIKKYVDNGVYNSKQQFRIVGSQKLDSNRPKIFNDKWKFKDTEIIYKYIETPDNEGHKIMLQLESTLITCINNCKILPSFIKEENNNKGSNSKSVGEYKKYEDEEITKEVGIEALKLLASFGGLTIDNPLFPYKFVSVSGQIVILKRIKPSNCRICKRIHENENPYLIIIGNEKLVYFHCRRADPNKKLLIGKLSPISENWIKQTISNMLNEKNKKDEIRQKDEIEQKDEIRNEWDNKNTNIEIIKKMGDISKKGYMNNDNKRNDDEDRNKILEVLKKHMDWKQVNENRVNKNI